jgi:flagellin
MSLRINQNVTSLSTYSNLNRTSARMDKSIGKLSSGLRINSAADDAAGLAISEKMRSQISGLNRAKLNAQDGVSMLQTAEGGLGETESIIQRMRELAIQGSNDTLTTNDRLEIQKEINQLRDAIDDIADSTEYNTKKLLDGSQTALISASSKSVSGTANGSGVQGGDFNVSMTVVQGGISQMQTSQMFMNKDTGNLALGNTKLEDIAQFYDENGVFALDTAQTLTVTGNAETAQFVLDGKMTLNELASALQNAIAGTSGLGIKNSSATVVSTAQSGVSGLGGYLQITSGKIGDVGEFSIAGDQAVIDALGMTISRHSANNIVQVSTKDASGNTRRVTTSTDVASSLLDGIDLKFASQSAQVAGNGGIVDGLKFTADATVGFSFKVGTATVNINTTFAASSCYSMEGIAEAINAKIAADATAKTSGIEATVVDGQIRISYNPTDPSSPTEIKISAGTDVIGLIEGTYTGFVDGDKDMNNAVKGFSMLQLIASNVGAEMKIKITDGASATETISVGKTVSAGDADLVEINNWVTTVNAKLANASVAARVDAVNGSIAFTSTQLGNKNVNGKPAVQSLLKIESTSSNTAVMSTDLLGYKDGTAKGAGDTNFRLHVVDNSPTFQIGANQGQNMKITISDMSASALGIDKLDMSTTRGAQKAIGKLDKALSIVSAERSKIGAFENRMNYTINNLENAATNLTDSESRVRDLDMAAEMTEFTSAQVLQQAATAMLAQANASGQQVLQLLS